MHRILSLILAAVMQVSLFAVNAEGNSDRRMKGSVPDTAELFYSPTVCVYDGTVYAAENGNFTRKTADDDGNVTTEILAPETGDLRYINASEKAFLAVCGNRILRIDSESYEISEAYVSQRSIGLFIMTDSGDLYTLEDGEIYKNGVKDFGYEESIDYYCPIDGGYIFSCGEVLSQTVYVYKNGAVSYISDAETWYTELDTLVINRADGDYMTEIGDITSVGSAAPLSEFNLYGGGSIDEALEGAEGDGSAALETFTTPPEDDLNTDAVVRKSISQGVENIRRRARQMAEIKWTALGDIPMYQQSSVADKTYFRKGVTYYGIPYGQPVKNKSSQTFIGPFSDNGENYTVDDFAREAADPDSDLYTKTGTYNNRVMPMYSNDCSSFVSYAWGSTRRFTTSDFRTVADAGKKYANVGTKVSQLQTGFALNKGGSHIILVYDVAYDANDGTVAHVTTMEQTPPIVRKRSWGVGGSMGSIADLQAKINGGYKIIKNLSADSVDLVEYASVPVDRERYINRITLPVSSRVHDSAASGTGTVLSSDKTFPIEGWSYNEEGCALFEYSIDGSGWNGMTKLKKGSLYTFYADAPVPSPGTHSVNVRCLTKTGEYYDVADITVNVRDTGPEYQVRFDSLGNGSASASSSCVKRTITYNSASSAVLRYSGHAECAGGTVQFEYKIDDGMWLSVETDLGKGLETASFNGAADLGSCSAGTTHTVYIRGVTSDNDVYDMAEVTVKIRGTAPSVSGISVNTLPDRVKYTTDEKLDTDGLSILVKYSDNTRRVIYGGYTCTYDFTEEGDRVVHVSYEGYSTDFGVTVTKAFTYGDVNGDGAVNSGDSSVLLQYLADWEVTGFVSEAADVDINGKIDTADSVRILQYIADWDVVLGR